MKRCLSLLIVLAILFSFAACGTPSQPDTENELDFKEGTVTTSWHEIGAGPSGWVIGIMVENNTSEQFTQDAVVTVVDDDGTVLGKDIIHIDVAPDDYNDYPVHCKVGDSYNVDIQTVNETVTDDSSENSTEFDEPKDVDNRGIKGMDPYALQSVLSGDPFYIPFPVTISPEEGTSYCAATCTATGGGESSGIVYDYSLSLDSDGEIVGASFGIAGTTASEQQLLTYADLYFYAISLMAYDTADTDTLSTWFSSSLKDANDTATTTTIGDATFELYGIPGVMYWVDISKN